MFKKFEGFWTGYVLLVLGSSQRKTHLPLESAAKLKVVKIDFKQAIQLEPSQPLADTWLEDLNFVLKINNHPKKSKLILI